MVNFLWIFVAKIKMWRKSHKPRLPIIYYRCGLQRASPRRGIVVRGSPGGGLVRRPEFFDTAVCHRRFGMALCDEVAWSLRSKSSRSSIWRKAEDAPQPHAATSSRRERSPARRAQAKHNALKERSLERAPDFLGALLPEGHENSNRVRAAQGRKFSDWRPASDCFRRDAPYSVDRAIQAPAECSGEAWGKGFIACSRRTISPCP